MTFALGFWLLAIGFLGAAGALALLAWLQARNAKVAPGLFTDPAVGAVFLFDGEDLLDASDAGRALLASLRETGNAWQRLMAYVLPRFPGLADDLRHLPERGQIALTSPGADALSLLAEWRGGITRLMVLESLADGQPLLVDTLAQQAQNRELAELRQVTDFAPAPIWREAADGSIIWANRTYVELAERVAGDGPARAWPLPQLFPPGANGRTAVSKSGKDGAHWFDCHQIDAGEAGRLVFATPADATVTAEDALRSFVQTLTKTFADLPIGLAIFDRQRKLQLFNPALTDLTGLPVEFLAARPGIFALFDGMRDRGTIPEPKDYKAWRSRMAALEASAARGDYVETWALSSGATYRVTGRPHPEGALALLFQDITDEISRARRFRADLELGQSVIDSTDEAIAVLSANGVLVMSNAAYARLWDHDPSEELSEQPVSRLAQRWRDGSAPSTVWAQVETYALTTGRREPWTAQSRLNDGRALVCRLAPLAGGATLVGFRPDRARPVAEAIADPPAATNRRPTARRV